MKFVNIVVLILLLKVCPCIAAQMIDLPVDQEAFFKKHIDSIELYLYIDDSINFISPAINQLKHLQLLKLAGYYSDVTIPLELLTLPKLQSLYVINLQMRLPAGIEVNQIQSNIETLYYDRIGNNDALLLTSLPQLQQLFIDIYWTIGHSDSENLRPGMIVVENVDLSLFLNSLPNLRKLHITNRGPMTIDPSICTLINLEELKLRMPYSLLPDCLNQLTNLRSMSVTTCSRNLRHEVDTNLSIVASLPNLESLTLWTNLWLEMPDASYGFNKLQELTLDKNPVLDYLVYDICPNDYYNSDAKSNINAVVTYLNLKKIVFEKEWLYNLPCQVYTSFYSFIDAFIRHIDAAWNEGMVNQLEQIMVGDDVLWQRPSSREMSGNMVPANWKAQE